MSVPSFANIADMQAQFEEEELIQLSNPTGSAIDAARMNKAIDRASNLILSKVAAKYDVAAGLAQTALDLLRDATCDIAFYYLHRETPNDGVKARFKEACAWLDQVADGRAKLDAGSQEATARPEGVLVSTPERKFGRDAMTAF